MSQNTVLDLSGKTAIVVGGTGGIGAEVARLLAQIGCSRVFIVGRNSFKASAVVKDMKSRVGEGSTAHFEFIRGDVSTQAGMLSAADAIQHAIGEGIIDYLIMTQNGVPHGTVNVNEDGYDTQFAIQCISRFALPYLLISRGCLSAGTNVFAVANPGGSLDDLKIEDLSLKGIASSGKYKHAVFWDQVKRDSAVLDASFEMLAVRYPEVKFGHLHPGVVKIKGLRLLGNTNPFPAPLNALFWMGLKLAGKSYDEIAPIIVSILTTPEKQPESGHARLYTINEKRFSISMGTWASDVKNRNALWEMLVSMVGK